MSTCTMYASYSDDEIIRLIKDRFFANELVTELVERFEEELNRKETA